MNKKLLTIGIVTCFILVLFLPLTIASENYKDKTIEESAPGNPSAVRIYGLAIVNGTIKEPKSLFPIIGKLFGYKIFFYADFTEGLIKPVYSLTKLRNINIPGIFNLAVIHGSFCKWDQFEKIDDTGEYIVGGTIIHLVVDLY